MPDQHPPAQPLPLAECESRLFETLRSIAPRRSEVLVAIRDYANAERRRIQGGGATTTGAPPYDSALHTAQALLREYMRDLPAVTVQRACDDLACISLDALERVLWKFQDRPAPQAFPEAREALLRGEAAGKPKAPIGTGMELPTADALVRKYIVDHAEHHTVTVRELVKEIRCSAGLISKCPAWQTYMKLRKAGRVPRAVGLTDKLMEITPAARHNKAESADRDEEIDRKEALERLIRDQEADQHVDRAKHFVPRRKP